MKIFPTAYTRKIKRSFLTILILIFLLTLCACKQSSPPHFSSGDNIPRQTTLQTHSNNTDDTRTSDATTTHTQTSTDAIPSTTLKTTTSKKADIKPTTHSHIYLDATCTQPARCACGATKGAALGHKWLEPTCTSAKTCSYCKLTEGSIGTHTYSDGYCIFCNKLQIINPKSALKEYANYYQVIDYDDGNYSLVIWQFYDSELHRKDVFSSNIDRQDRDYTITYKGKTWYAAGFGGPLPRYTLTDQEIILKYDNLPTEFAPAYSADEYRLIVTEKGDLVVTFSNGFLNRMYHWEKDVVLELVE